MGVGSSGAPQRLFPVREDAHRKVRVGAVGPEAMNTEGRK